MRLSALTTLPKNYRQHSAINLLQHKPTFLGLMIAGIIFLVGFSWLGVRLALHIRPDARSVLVPFDILALTPNGGFSLKFPLPWIVGAVLALPIVIITHEAIHGIIFWLFTHRRPHFGIKGLVAYAAPPAGLYIPRNAYLIVALAPLVVLTLAGLILLLFVPATALALIICIVSFNISGSVGDSAVTVWLLQKPSHTLIEDRGEVMIVYGINKLT